MYKGRIGAKRKGHWQYITFALGQINGVYALAEMYRTKMQSKGVTIKFEEVPENDPANKA